MAKTDWEQYVVEDSDEFSEYLVSQDSSENLFLDDTTPLDALLNDIYGTDIVPAKEEPRQPFQTSGLERFGLGMTNTITGGAAGAIDDFLANVYNQEPTEKDFAYGLGRGAGYLQVGSVLAKGVGAIPGLGQAQGLLPSVTRGALESGLAAAYGTPEGRLEAGVGGALVGGAVTGVAYPFVKIAQAKSALKAQEAALKAQGVPVAEGRNLKLSQRASGGIAKVKAEITAANKEVQTAIKMADEEIFKQANKDVTAISTKLPKFFKDNSEAYGKRIDTISEQLISSGRKMTRGQIDDIIDNTIREIEGTGVQNSQVVTQLNSMKKALGSQVEEAAARPILSASGNPFSSSPATSNASEAIIFKDFVEAAKKVKKSLSSQAKGGGKFTQEDLGIALFNKNVGNVVPELRALNGEYKPVIDAMKEATKKFKPFNGNLQDRTGINFLKKVAHQGTKGLTDGEKALLQAIEQGDTNFAMGIGTVTDTLKKLGIKRQNLVEALQNNKDKISKMSLNLAKNKASIVASEADLAHMRHIRNTLITVGSVGVGLGVAKNTLSGLFPLIP